MNERKKRGTTGRGRDPFKKQMTVFRKEIQPLMEKLGDLCEENGMAVLSMVQIHTDEIEGPKLMADCRETADMAPPIVITKGMLDGSLTFHRDDWGEYSLRPDDYDMKGAIPFIPSKFTIH